MTKRSRNPYPMIGPGSKPREGWTELYVRAAAYVWKAPSLVTLRLRYGAQQANRRHREEKAGLITALKERTRDLRALEWLNQMGFRAAIDTVTLRCCVWDQEGFRAKKDSWYQCALALGMKEDP